MSKELLRAIPFAAGLIVIALVAGLPSGCGDQINKVDVPQHAADTTSPVIPEKQDSKGLGAHAPAAHAKPAAVLDVKPLVKGWTKPAVTLVFSGEQHGYMEPCGCSVTQSGGLSRRGDLMRQLAEKGWPFAAIDLGGLVRKDNQQNKIKFQVMLAALKDLGYKAMALGPEELSLERLEPGFLVTQGPQPSGAQAQDGPSFVNANVEFTLFKDAGLRPAALAKVITINGHRIGVTAIFGKTLTAALFGEAGDPQIKVNDPAKSLPPAIAELKRQNAEVFILLSHAEKNESAELAKKFPEFQIVATARGPEDGEDTAEHLGNTLLVTVGQKGKHVAIVGYYPDDQKRPFRYELVDLDKERFKDTPKMLDRMREYQHMLEANYDAVLKDFARPPSPNGDQFAGVDSCKDCHKKAYARWMDSKHAHAYESLITGREGTKDPIPRNHDPECINCHTTGWDPQGVFPYVGGFYSLERTPKLKDQQCENCHGPAAKHVELELAWKRDQKSVKKADLDAARVRATLKVAEIKKTLCYKCHDLDNDPNFEFDTYWDQIKHPGKD
jgi:Cytochrome c554 and c-prime